MKEGRVRIKAQYTLASMLILFLVSFAFNIDADLVCNPASPHSIASYVWLALSVLSAVACLLSFRSLHGALPKRALVKRCSLENGKGFEFLLTFIFPIVQGRSESWNQLAVSLFLMCVLFLGIYKARLYMSFAILFGRKLYNIDASILSDTNCEDPDLRHFEVAVRGIVVEGAIITLETSEIGGIQFANIKEKR